MSSFWLKTITCAAPWLPPSVTVWPIALQHRDRVGGEAEALEAEAIGQPLVMDAAGVDRFLRVHAEVDDVEDRHQHGVDDRAAARACR